MLDAPLCDCTCSQLYRSFSSRPVLLPAEQLLRMPPFRDLQHTPSERWLFWVQHLRTTLVTLGSYMRRMHPRCIDRVRLVWTIRQAQRRVATPHLDQASAHTTKPPQRNAVRTRDVHRGDERAPCTVAATLVRGYGALLGLAHRPERPDVSGSCP